MDKDDYIKREREADDKRRKNLFKEHVPRIRIDRIKGSLSREKLNAAEERVRGAILKAATYEPSERAQKIKEDAYDVAHTVRSELQEAGDYYTGGGKPKRERRSKREYSDADDYYSQRSVEAYAEAFAPPSLRIDSQGRRTGRRYDTDAPSQVQKSGQDDFVSYLEHFDQFTSKGKGKKSRKSKDIIGVWFE